MKPFFQRPQIRAYQPIILPTQYINKENNAPVNQNQFHATMRQHSAPQQVMVPKKQIFIQQRAFPAPQPLNLNNRQTFSKEQTMRKPSQFESVVFNESRIIEIHENQNFDLKKILQQKEDNIKQQASMIESLCEQLNIFKEYKKTKIQEYEEIQTNNLEAFDQYRNEINQKIEGMSTNFTYDESVQTFLVELDKKAVNLQNHVNENMQLMKDIVDEKQRKTEHLCANVSSNIGIRLNDDENYLKGELEIIKTRLGDKMDATSIRQEIANQIQRFRQDMSQIESQIRQQCSSHLNSQEEQNLQTQDSFTKSLQMLEIHMQSQFKAYEDTCQSLSSQAQDQQQEKKILQQQLSVLKNKFSSIQVSFQQHQKNNQQKLNLLQKDNLSMQKELKTVQLENQQLKKQQQDQKQNSKVSNVSTVRTMSAMSPLDVLRDSNIRSPLDAKKSKIDRSYLSGNSLSTKADKDKQVQVLMKATSKYTQQAKNQVKETQRAEISFEEFTDFHDNSVCGSMDSNSCEFFYPTEQNPFSRVEESPIRNKQSEISKNLSSKQSESFKNQSSKQKKMNENILQSDDTTKNYKQKKMNDNSQFSKTQQLTFQLPQQSQQMTEIRQALKRRMLYNNQANSPLLCQQSREGYLSDLETGLYILNEQGEPLIVTQAEQKQLQHEGSICFQT